MFYYRGMGKLRDPYLPSPGNLWTLPDALRRGKRHYGQRHCWVRGTADHPMPQPGLIVEWRRIDKTWFARVVHITGEPDQATLAERWVPQYDIRPAE